MKLIDSHIVSIADFSKFDLHELETLLLHTDEIIYLHKHIDSTADIKKLASFINNFNVFPYVTLNITQLESAKLRSLIGNQDAMTYFISNPSAFFDILNCDSPKFDVLVRNISSTRLLLDRGILLSDIINIELGKLNILTHNFQTLFVLLGKNSFSEIIMIDSEKLDILLTNSGQLMRLLYQENLELEKLGTLYTSDLRTIMTNIDSIDGQEVLKSLQGSQGGLSI